MSELKLKVLVVGDTRTMRKLQTKFLNDLGFFDILEAEDGLEAWSKLKANKSLFGLILSDRDMPNLDGLELVKLIRNDHKLMHTPFLMISSDMRQTQIDEAYAVGVDEYLSKNFDKVNFLEKLFRAFIKHHEIKRIA